jgi:hypothetical protein
MRKNKITSIAFFLVAIFNSAFATTFTWTAGGVGNSASNPLNWAPSILGVPASGDDVVFDGTAVNDCDWDIPVVNSFSVLTGYSGTIYFLLNPVINGTLAINSGSVVSTLGDLTLAGSGAGLFSLGGTGIFNPNNGNVILQVDPGQTFTFQGTITLNTLTVEGSNLSNNPRNINFGSNLTVDVLVMAVGFKEHSYQGSVHIKQKLDVGGNAFAAAYTNIPPNNTAYFIFDGANAFIEGVSNPFKAPLSNITINTSGTYTLVDKLNVYGDWRGTQGTLAPGNSQVNLFGTLASINGTAAAFHDLVIKNSAIVSMPSNAEVKISGSIDQNGTLIFQSTTALGLNGNGLQIVNGPGFTLAGLKAYGSGSARSVNINTPINVLDSIKVGDQVTLSSGLIGNITLKSFNALTARVAELGNGASVTGNVNVETFLPGGTTGWATLGVRGVANQKVSDWDTWVSSGGLNGIPMTCSNCSYPQTATPYWFNSIMGWSEATDKFDTSFKANSPLVPGRGHWVYVGDGFTTTGGLKLINTGDLVQGVVSMPVSATGSVTFPGYNLVANPYPCPISWSLTLANNGGTNNFSNAIYAYNADISDYTSFVAGVSTPSSGGITDVIPAGQGFFVESTGLSASINFIESVKVSNNTNANPLYKTSANTIGQVFRLHLTGAGEFKETVFRIHPEATVYYDKNWDARKFFETPGYAGYPGAYNKYTTISSRLLNKDYSINSLPPVQSGTMSIPILVRVISSGNYSISASGIENFNACLILKDNLSNTYHNLKTSPYVCFVSDTTTTPRFELILCESGNTTSTLINALNTTSGIFIFEDNYGALVQTKFDQNTKATISVYNMLGQKLITDILIEGTITTTPVHIDLHNQAIIIKVTSDKAVVTKKIVLH